MGGARVLDQSPTEQRFLAALRLCYGFTPREARRHLEAMRREPHLSLQEHAATLKNMKDNLRRDARRVSDRAHIGVLSELFG